ncbi:hypothetical protein JA33_194 [Dickeya phage vB_DsoM_JA33]|uniref:Uncharacterized protein n=3 Tax=Salmondvirus JA11 TaxID=2734141 RepID=A0A384ZWJ1_9CAUD|nr:hypothetical protein HOU32_gp194 [Dickeya phage vB_DsoM_JA11]AXG66597.1 hypothetical protein JA13_194 [Dickeya phage vB_DsoM_JA13]AXG67568.1 hypothetical protein JA33_194 [Dickeya phage vB_DsoM_JA33]AYD79999.1 hypothetical protein JA11_194 [Dickeya phage vB_DsoM_JA11]
MLIDELNRKGEDNQVFPITLDSPLAMYEAEGMIFVGCLADYGDGIWILDPHLYNTETDTYSPVKISFKFTNGEDIHKVTNSDTIRHHAKTANFNLGMISGIPFVFPTRIH